MKKALIAALLLLSLPIYGNPFLSNGDTSAEAKPLIKQSQPRVFAKVLRPIIDGQRVMYKRVSRFMKSLKTDPAPSVLFLLLGSVFVYGFLHALGPGHGKIFILSYVVSKKISLLNGFFIGIIIAFFHSALSVIMLLVLNLVIEKSVLSTIQSAEYWLKLVSYLLILALGGYLFYHAFEHFRGKCSCHTHDHSHEHGSKRDRNFIIMAISIAIVPCPGTVLILLFAMTNNLLMLGLLSVTSMAFGMAVSLSLVGLITVFAKEKGMELLGRTEKAQDRLSGVATLVGSVIIVVTSTVMLAGTIRI